MTIGHADELRDLGQEDQDRERIDEAGQHRLRNEPHQPAELEQPGDDLEQAHQDRGGEQILDAVIVDEAGHQHGGRRGCGRDHRGAAAGEGDDAGDDDRGVQADLRIDAGDDRKADRFGDQRERDDDARQDFETRVEKPFTNEGGFACSWEVGPQSTHEGTPLTQRLRVIVSCALSGGLAAGRATRSFTGSISSALHIEAFHAAMQQCRQGRRRNRVQGPKTGSCDPRLQICLPISALRLSPESGVRHEDAKKANRRRQVREALAASQEGHKHGHHQQ